MWQWAGRRIAALAVAWAVAAAAMAQQKSWREPGPFYRWQEALPERAGVLLRSQPLEPELMLTQAASGLRILYTSKGHTDEVVPVSGMVFLPRGEAPEGGWPVLAWAHGTTGIADRCAPSLNPASERDAAFLNHWLQTGYAIVATDYEGLGTPGPQPYLHCASEAYSIIHSVQAARELALPLTREWVAMGQSQGGHGALCAAAHAGLRAEELGFLGALATAPAIHFMERLSQGHPSTPDPFIGLTLMMARGFEAYSPSFSIEQVFSSRARALLQVVDRSCVQQVIEAGAELGLTSGDSLKVLPFSEAPGVAEAARHQEIPLQGWSALPVYLAQGTGDRMVSPGEVVRFSEQLCEQGARLNLDLYPRAGHSGPMIQGLQAFEEWVAARFAGEVAPSHCGDPGHY